jgi:SAM-dependent methyltransferase
MLDKNSELSKHLELATYAWRDVMSPYGDEWGHIRLPGATPLHQDHVNGASLYAHRNNYLDDLPKHSICAEIGVWNGDFSAEILRRNDPKELHLIDFDIEGFSLRDRFADDPRVVLHEGHSVDILSRFPAEYFDWIYVDAGHDYESVKADAAASALRLKRGGIMVFNDYIFWSHTEALPYGVVQAVNEMCVHNGWRVVAFCFHDAMYCDIAITRQNVPHDSRAIYDRAFFTDQIEGSTRGARIVVPLVMKLVRDVRSVVDVGCGTGGWLASFKEAGVPRVLGLDGGAVEEQLAIEPHEFRVANLEQDIDIDETFDLCICLEVAEHLTARAAPVIVRNICKLSDVVLFSAAIPGQGGSHHHNERWPSYWIDLFASAGYEVIDAVRGRMWNDGRVEWWYRQNLLLLANKAGLSRIDLSLATTAGSTPLDIVHPACFEYRHRLNVELEETHSQRVFLLEQQNAKKLVLLKQQIANLEQQKANWEQRSADLERDLQAILNSTSWKLTWPLRTVFGKNDNLRRKLRALTRIGG